MVKVGAKARLCKQVFTQYSYGGVLQKRDLNKLFEVPPWPSLVLLSGTREVWKNCDSNERLRDANSSSWTTHSRETGKLSS